MINAGDTGKKIAQLRKEKGLTQKELASALNVTDKAISKWERGINFPELTIMEKLAEELDTSVMYLLSLENASTKEAVESVTEISTSEKERVLKELRVRSYLKIIIEIMLFCAMIKASKIFADNNIYGQGQILTLGMVGFISSLIGMEMYTVRKLNISIKKVDLIHGFQKNYANLKECMDNVTNVILIYVAVISVMVYIGIQFLVGISPNKLITVLLFVITAMSVQLLACRIFALRILKLLPLFFTALLAIWGTWLYFTSPAWRDASIWDLLCNYVSPTVGCLLVVLEDNIKVKE